MSDKILSREEFLMTVLHQWGAATAECRDKLESHDAALRAALAEAMTSLQEQEDECETMEVERECQRALKESAENKLAKAQQEVERLKGDLAQSRVQEIRNYLASPAMATFADLKHSKAGTVLAMLGDGAISRGKCCEVLAQLAHGVPFDEIKLPEENGRQFSEDEIPAEVVAELEAELAKERETSRELRELFTDLLKWMRGLHPTGYCGIGPLFGAGIAALADACTKKADEVEAESARLIAKGPTT